MSEIITKIDSNGNVIYHKIDNYECWCDYDKNNNKIHYKDCNGYEEWYEYDENNNMIHYKNTDGTEEWCEYDSDNNIMNCKKHIEEKVYDRDTDCTCHIITTIEKYWYPGKIK